MIVICTKCQAKFRVADDKIGPRGAKVRCSRCQTVFVVQRDAAAPALESGAAASPENPFTANPVSRSNMVAPAPAPAPPPSSESAPPDDPFAPRAPTPGPPPDPFGDADPFATAAAPRATLPVTDLADLLGPGPAPAAAPPPRPSAVPPPLPFARAAVAPLAPPADLHDDPFDLAPPAPAAPLPPPAPARIETPPDEGGLALEDRLTPPPMKVMPADPFAAGGEAASGDPFGDPFPAPGAPFDPGSFDYAPEPGEAALAIATAEPPAAPAPEPAPPAPAPQPLAVPDRPGRAAAASAAAPRERIPGHRGSRLRAVALNAVALAALLLVSLAILVVWRTGGSIDAASLRPAAVLGVLRGGGASKGPFVASELRSGVYERARGAPILFVRGKAVSRAAAAVGALKVSVELVRAGEVLARGEAIAGAVPTPEELHSAADDAALALVAEAARARAPAEVRPGDAVPFLVALGAAPPELEGATLRLELAPAASGAP
jgi:Meckel syndrome type 1 protein